MGKSPYSEELRNEVVALARKSGSSKRQIARDFGISEFTVYEWVKKADEQQGTASSDGNLDDIESRELKKRIRILEQENEVLRRATAYFSQAVLPK